MCYNVQTVTTHLERIMFGVIFDVLITIFCVILLFNFFIGFIGLVLMVIGMIGVVDHNENIYFIPLILGLMLISSR